MRVYGCHRRNTGTGNESDSLMEDNGLEPATVQTTPVLETRSSSSRMASDWERS